jgi:hypothetical protein
VFYSLLYVRLFIPWTKAAVGKKLKETRKKKDIAL